MCAYNLDIVIKSELIMTTPNLSEEQAVILGLGAKKRLAYMFETVQQFKQVWILNDEKILRFKA